MAQALPFFDINPIKIKPVIHASKLFIMTGIIDCRLLCKRNITIAFLFLGQKRTFYEFGRTMDGPQKFGKN